MTGLSPRDWTVISAFGCILFGMIVAGSSGLGRDENMKWQLTTDANRVPAFFAVLLITAGIAIYIFGPKGT